MKKVILWIILILLFLLAAASAAFVYFFVLPYRNAASAMPEGVILTVTQDQDDTLHLSWPEADIADYYCVELQLPQTQAEIEEEIEPTVIFREYVHGTTCALPQIVDDREVVIQVSTVVEYEAAGKIQRRKGDTPVQLTTVLNIPHITDIQWTPDEEADTVSVSWNPIDATHCRIYLVQSDGTAVLLRTLEESQTVFTFGEGQDIPLPGFDETCTLVFDAYRLTDGLEYYGYTCGDMQVVREDLLGRELGLTLTYEGLNMYTLTWEETKGSCYQVQQLDADTQKWVTLEQIPRDGQRTYTTGHLANLSDFSFRVLAPGGQVMENSEYAAVSEELSITTEASPLYCTIWPMKDLEAFSAPSGGEVVGKVKTARAYCVIDEAEGMFGIRLDGQTCYIDSNYCMINLPEIYGDLISYEITNSYASLYMVHEFEIPEVTDVVTAGYKYVQMSSGEFLVPLLYPTARKLLVAAQDAVARGYRLKIYDAYRPNEATREIYDLTEKILKDPIPDEPFTDKKIEELDLPKLEDKDGKEGEEGEEEEKITYELLMTNNTWSLGSFLAKGGSLHNLGIAVDLTLEDLNGRELKMQTSMHDLSWYSTPSRNNANAKLLAEIMTGAGLGGLVSEWWHFQDNEIREQLQLPCVWSGVTPECWMTDDHGWRYRRYNGNYFADCTRTIDGVEYIFDAYGYVTGVKESS